MADQALGGVAALFDGRATLSDGEQLVGGEVGAVRVVALVAGSCGVGVGRVRLGRFLERDDGVRFVKEGGMWGGRGGRAALVGGRVEGASTVRMVWRGGDELAGSALQHQPQP
jgi:hypothetical protein